MICPMMSKAGEIVAIDENGTTIVKDCNMSECKTHECAWYIKEADRCAMTQIAMNGVN